MMSFSFIAVMVNYYDHHRRLVDELNRKCPNCRLLPLDWNNNLLSNSGYNAGNEEERVARVATCKDWSVDREGDERNNYFSE